jgi:hypothetical protein
MRVAIHSRQEASANSRGFVEARQSMVSHWSHWRRDGMYVITKPLWKSTSRSEPPVQVSKVTDTLAETKGLNMMHERLSQATTITRLSPIGR